MRKILVVDDDPEIVELVRDRLEASNYKVITASNGEQGMEKIEQENPSMVILDVAMPKMDGYTFVLELKKSGRFKDLPIVMLTAKENIKGLFNMEGVSHYFIKPFVAEELLKTMDHIFKDKPEGVFKEST